MGGIVIALEDLVILQETVKIAIFSRVMNNTFC